MNSAMDAPTVSKPVVKEDTQVTPRLAPRYRVLVHNDEVTTAEFVVDVLIGIFKKDVNEAVSIMETAHHSGVALVVVLSLEEAELRVEQAIRKHAQRNFR